MKGKTQAGLAARVHGRFDRSRSSVPNDELTPGMGCMVYPQDFLLTRICRLQGRLG